jgi:hypothetical protein
MNEKLWANKDVKYSVKNKKIVHVISPIVLVYICDFTPVSILLYYHVKMLLDKKTEPDNLFIFEILMNFKVIF